MVLGGETTRVCGAKRLGLKIEAKRLGGKQPGGKRLVGETSCYHFSFGSSRPKQFLSIYLSLHTIINYHQPADT